MAKTKSKYRCSECGAIESKWVGQCGDCKAWNTMTEFVDSPEPAAAANNRYTAWAGESGDVTPLSEVSADDVQRVSTGMGELDRVLGGGMVPGSVILIGGDPGIGKSTLLLQVMAYFGEQGPVLYATGEESKQQVSLRAKRLGRGAAKIDLMAEISLEKILATADSKNPTVMVVDSIQTVYSGALTSAPGSVAQVRECAAQLTRLAKTQNTTLILVGHVTKEGDLAGPRVLEHMVDTVLQFEGEPGSPYRMLRAAKNRYGAVNEIGVFAMGGTGLEEVSNPSSMFLTTHEKPVSGSCVLATMEGTRPFLVEVQALVEESAAPNPRRFAQGFDLNKLQMLLAVLNKHTGTVAFDQNVYLKVVGGVRLTEPGADLASLMAVHSSVRNKPLPKGLVVFGEVGLAGEVRPVIDAEGRLREAAKLGFTQAIIPAANKVTKSFDGLKVHAVNRVDQALTVLREIHQSE